MIDTNVLVHWLMATNIMESVAGEFDLGEELVRVYRKRYEPSCSFVDKVLQSRGSGREFVVTELSLNETFSGIRDEVRSVILFVKGVPISRWASKRETKEVSFPESLSKKIYESTLRAFDSLYGQHRIVIIPVTKPSDEENYFDIYSSLIFLNPHLMTQDAILLTTAIFEQVDCFVTADKGLTTLGRQLFTKYHVEVLPPEKAIRYLVE